MLYKWASVRLLQSPFQIVWTLFGDGSKPWYLVNPK
jgi:hypothetical protein